MLCVAAMALNVTGTLLSDGGLRGPAVSVALLSVQEGCHMGQRSFDFGATSSGASNRGGSPRSVRAARRWNRALSVPLSLILLAAAVTSVTLALGAQPASAIGCFNAFNCAPTNVQFSQPNQQKLSDLGICGITGNFAPLAAEEIDNNLDNPN